jgi:putative hydrolase of the HAD superfamily
MIKAIIFDFGRVISAQKPLHLFRMYEKDLGLAPGLINKIMFDSQEWHNALLGRLTAKDFWYAIGGRLGLNSRRRIDAFRRRYQADESINTGVQNILRKLHGRYKLAVLSNSPPGLDQWLLDWDMSELFDVVFCSGDEGLAKPDPAAYKTVLHRLGVLPHEAIFIDDTSGHVSAARKLGIQGIIFTRASRLKRDLNALLTQKNHNHTE